MLNRAPEPVNDAKESSCQTLQPYQSLWLAHWKPTASDPAGDNASPSASRGEELHHTKRPEASSMSANGVGSIKNTAFEISHNFMKIGRKSISNPDEFDIKTGKFNKGKAAVSIGFRQLSVEDEQRCGERHTGLLCDKSSGERLRESNSCDHCSSVINGAWFLKMQKCCPGIRLSPSQSNSCEENETTISCIDCCSKLKLQKYGHGLGTMRICSGTDISGGARAGMDDLLITKQNGVNAFKENDIFRSKRVITNISGDVHCILPFFGHNKQKVQHQALSNLNGSEVKGYLGDAKASKVTIRNELSAETDTMNLDSFKEKKFKKNLHSASNSITSTKAFDMESNETVSSTKVEQRWLNKKLLLCSPQNTCLTSSKALTIETGKLHEHVKQPKAESDFSLDKSPVEGTGNRWVKRLKISSSNSSTPKYASSTPREETSKLFNGIPVSSTTTSKPNERSLISDKSEDSLKMDEGKAMLVSHAWIQRWLHTGGREMKKECEIKKSGLGEEREEQFPSIGAMALMSKVLTCVQQCELQKKGPYTVWNTKRSV